MKADLLTMPALATVAAADTERVPAGRPVMIDSEAGRKISQLVFSQMVEGMLPRSGGGLANDVWRSKFAAELGRAISERGVDLVPQMAIGTGTSPAKGGQR